MPIGTTAALIAGGGALLGGVAGALGKNQKTDSESYLDAGQAGLREQKGLFDSEAALDRVNDYTQVGANQSDVAAGAQGARDLASMYGDYAKTGGLPGQGDVDISQGFAKDIFAARQTGLDQSFQDQNVQANRLAASLGRSVDDPILQAKLRTGFLRQQDQLNSDRTGYASQLALALPGQRLGYAERRANALSGLASQAFQNQANVISLGSGIADQERNFRIATAHRYGNQNVSSGGGLGGALEGALTGLGGGLGAASKFGLMGGGGGGLTSPTGFAGTNGLNFSGGNYGLPAFGGSSGFGGGLGGGPSIGSGFNLGANTRLF
jgi:hypothetical protein